jgi:hypothetical protein
MLFIERRKKRFSRDELLVVCSEVGQTVSMLAHPLRLRSGAVQPDDGKIN